MSTDDALPALPPVDPGSADAFPGDALSPELLAGLLADGDDQLAAWALRHALRSEPRAVVYDGLLADAMALVGERWQTGRWSVAEEHLASQTLLRALDRIRPDPGPEGRIGPLAVLGGVAGEQHMIGLVCLDHVLHEMGWTVADLGADVPTADLVRFVERNEALLVALTASDPSRDATAVGAIDAVRAAASGRTGLRGGSLPVMLGGRLAGYADAQAVQRADWAGVSIVAAAAFADQTLRALAPRAT